MSRHHAFIALLALTGLTLAGCKFVKTATAEGSGRCRLRSRPAGGEIWDSKVIPYFDKKAAP